VFKLEEEQLLLNAGKARWVNHASGRSRSCSTNCGRPSCWGGQGRSSRRRARAAFLSGPAFAVPGLPRTLVLDLRRHRQAFLELTSEVRDLSERNRHLLAKGRDAAGRRSTG